MQLGVFRGVVLIDALVSQLGGEKRGEVVLTEGLKEPQVPLRAEKRTVL